MPSMTHAVKVSRSPSMPLSGGWWPLRHGLGLFLGDLPQVRLPVCLVLVHGPGEGGGLLLGHLRLSLGPHGLGLRGLRPGSFGLRLGPFGLPRRLAPGVAAYAAGLYALGDLPDKSHDDRLLGFGAFASAPGGPRP